MNIQFFKYLLNHKGKSLGLVVAVLTTFLFNAMGGSFEIWSSVFLAAAMYIAVQYYLFERQQNFSQRIEKEHHSMWLVTMNGVQIGVLSDAQYATIQKSVFNNGRIALLQCANFGRMALMFLGRLFSGVPILLFWFALISFYISPDSVVGFFKAFQTGSSSGFVEALEVGFSSDISNIISGAISLTTCTLVVSYVISMLLGGRVGFVNKYDEEINKMLRVHFNTPAEGDIKLHLMQGAADSRVDSSLA